jgi:hypothetical protein
MEIQTKVEVEFCCAQCNGQETLIEERETIEVAEAEVKESTIIDYTLYFLLIVVAFYVLYATLRLEYKHFISSFNK